ncbi:MAG: nucleotidyltransferase domain-containing protein [Thermoanaerobaculia bacterium]|nr:nucleotidyltransferase domain-containing protein [Thermoanaerobaculia bacterium]
MSDEGSVASALRAYFEDEAPEFVVAAYLFGSEAEGRAHRESDVDVGVLVDREALPEKRQRFDYRVRLGSELIARLHRNRVDVVLLGDAPPLLARRIVTEGDCVYRRAPAADHDFVRDVQLRAADVAPFVERGRRRLLERLRS